MHDWRAMNVMDLLAPRFQTHSLSVHTQTMRARDLQFWHNVHQPLCVTWHMSFPTCHMSGVRCKVSHVSCHMSPLTPKPLELGSWNFERRLTSSHLSPVICHLSCVTCHMSRVTCHMSFFPPTKCWSCLQEGLFSMGPTPSSLDTTSYPSQHRCNSVDKGKR